MKLRVVCVQEGLGNQMFQYAFLQALKRRYPHDFVLFEVGSYRYDRAHYGYELGRVFGIKPHGLSHCFEERKLSRLHGLVRGVYEQGGGQYLPLTICTVRPIVFYRGFWQSWRYAESVREVLKDHFCFQNHLLSVQNRKFAAKVRSEDSVSVHIRAGDYYSNSEAFALLGGVCDTDYYLKAMANIKGVLPNARFYIFTNDIVWVQKHLSDLPGEFVDWNQGNNSWADMYLMSCCRHNIIANSSFSWWGAWLGDFTKKIVIAPKRWFKGVESTDIIPKEWIQL